MNKKYIGEIMNRVWHTVGGVAAILLLILTFYSIKNNDQPTATLSVVLILLYRTYVLEDRIKKSAL